MEFDINELAPNLSEIPASHGEIVDSGSSAINSEAQNVPDNIESIPQLQAILQFLNKHKLKVGLSLQKQTNNQDTQFLHGTWFWYFRYRTQLIF